ncbi:hypothetical protein Tco_0660362 [Tanacetum coccineum]
MFKDASENHVYDCCKRMNVNQSATVNIRLQQLGGFNSYDDCCGFNLIDDEGAQAGLRKIVRYERMSLRGDEKVEGLLHVNGGSNTAVNWAQKKKLINAANVVREKNICTANGVREAVNTASCCRYRTTHTGWLSDDTENQVILIFKLEQDASFKG